MVSLAILNHLLNLVVRVLVGLRLLLHMEAFDSCELMEVSLVHATLHLSNANRTVLAVPRAVSSGIAIEAITVCMLHRHVLIVQLTTTLFDLAIVTIDSLTIVVGSLGASGIRVTLPEDIVVYATNIITHLTESPDILSHLSIGDEVLGVERLCSLVLKNVQTTLTLDDCVDVSDERAPAELSIGIRDTNLDLQLASDWGEIVGWGRPLRNST